MQKYWAYRLDRKAFLPYNTHWSKVNLDYKTRKGSGFFKILILFSPHSRNVVWRLLYKEQKMNQTYMKEKKIFPLVMSMALPMMLSMAFNSL